MLYRRWCCFSGGSGGACRRIFQAKYPRSTPGAKQSIKNVAGGPYQRLLSECKQRFNQKRVGQQAEQ